MPFPGADAALQSFLLAFSALFSIVNPPGAASRVQACAATTRPPAMRSAESEMPKKLSTEAPAQSETSITAAA